MITIVRANERHFSDFGWLKTYWLFSFSDFYDPDNIQFGSLRVFNDDIVEPGTGFPTHPHREMEIVTIVLEGEITHEDSMGNKMVVKAGDVQRMSAGTGLTHSEFNLSDEPLHLYQIWILPDDNNLKPAYEQKNFSPSSRKNQLLPVVSGQGYEGAVTCHTAATIYMADLDAGEQIEFTTDISRKIFLYVTEGELVVNKESLSRCDQARIELEEKIEVQSKDETSLVLIDVPANNGKTRE
jgi:redox-sensitive bicupin YhaK (pirin superfamily)